MQTVNYPGTNLVRSGVQVKKENEKFTVMRSRSPQNLEFGYFTLLFEEGGKKMDQTLKRASGAILFLVKPIVLRRCRCRRRSRSPVFPVCNKSNQNTGIT